MRQNIQPRRAPRARVAHFGDYAFNDSLAGVRYAASRGYAWIDLNFHVTADGVLVCTHWSTPLKHGFRDPLGKIPRDRKVWEMTFAEVKRLRHVTGRRIWSAMTILRLAARLGIGVEFEAKDSPAFTQAKPWKRLAHIQSRTGVKLRVKSIHSLGAGLLRLRAAHRAGHTTIVLPRASRTIDRKWWPYIDYVRGPVRWIG